MIDNTFTNLLLITLIGLIGTIAKIFYDKLEDSEELTRSILISDMGTKKDIEHLKETVSDHNERITELEKK